MLLTGSSSVADIAMALGARRLNIPVTLFSFHGHRDIYVPDTRLLKVKLEDADPFLNMFARKMEIRLPTGKDLKALQRDYFILLEAQSLIVVGHGGELGRVAGTCAMFVIMHPGAPIYAYDMSVSRWERWSNGTWVPVRGSPPIPRDAWAGIGDGNLTQEGMDAIYALFE